MGVAIGVAVVVIVATELVEGSVVGVPEVARVVAVSVLDHVVGSARIVAQAYAIAVLHHVVILAKQIVEKIVEAVAKRAVQKIAMDSVPLTVTGLVVLDV